MLMRPRTVTEGDDDVRRQRRADQDRADRDGVSLTRPAARLKAIVGGDRRRPGMTSRLALPLSRELVNSRLRMSSLIARLIGLSILALDSRGRDAGA